LEICLVTGRRASELRDQWAARSAQVESRLRGILLRRPRAELHARIATRTRAMLDGGAIEEAAAMSNPGPNCAKIIGFREIRRLISGEIARPECEELINAATRQYAKRQETWFRRETWLAQIGI
jgi:tRNA dimethylallyltransferase